MSNNNQIPVNMGNIPIQTNQMNPLNQMNLVFLNSNLANLNLQNNIQMNQNFIINKLIQTMESFDVLTFQTLLSNNQFNSQIKNFLLNHSILLYLIHFNQANAQNPLRQIITILLKVKANPNLRLRIINNQNNLINYNNNYAIFPIVEKNDIELVKVFLDNNVDINLLDSQGRNCLFYLMINPNNSNNLIDKRPLCSLLCTKGIKINIFDNNGISPMMESINKGYIYIMNMLIKYGGDANLENTMDGNTPLHYAIKNKNYEALYILLGKGNCDINKVNRNGESPLDLAKKLTNESNKDIYELIMKFAGKEKSDEENNKKKDKKINEDNKNNNNEIDKMFIFPKGDINSRVEIPFAFQNNNPYLNYNDSDSSSSNNTNNNNLNNFTQFHSFIKIQNPPTLYLDISDRPHQDKLIYDSVKSENQELEKTLEKKQNKLQNFKNENDILKNELHKLQMELNQKKNQIGILTEQIKQEENKYFKQRIISQEQIEQKDKAIQSLLIKFKNLENELKNEKKENEKKNIEEINKENEESEKKEENKINNCIDNEKLKYLEKKFADEKYSDTEVAHLLTTDLYDFYHYNRIILDTRMQEITKMINTLKELIEINVDIKLYGSYATKTSLAWSEVDLLIMPNKDPNYINENFYINFFQNLFHKLKNSIYGKVFYLEDTQIITPIIRVESSDNNINLVYNIYILENTNYGEEVRNLDDNSLLNSVKMTNEYNIKYKGKFIPLLLGLKQILYNANLINNYNSNNTNSDLNINLRTYKGISSYALNVMLMSFLDEYSNYINDIQLGQIFIDFLKIHGYLMHENNNRKIIYIDYNNNGHNEKNEEIKFYNENNNIDSLIIIDPFNIRNNLLKNYDYNEIKTALMIGFCVIKDSCECSCHYDDSIGYQGKTHCILNRIFKSVKRFNNKRQNQ